MTTEEQLPEPVQEEDDAERQPALPPPPGRPTTDWAERASRALEARELGRKLRKGKRVLFPSLHSQSH